MGYFGFRPMQAVKQRIDTKFMTGEGLVVVCIKLLDDYAKVTFTLHGRQTETKMQTDSREERYVFIPSEDERLRNYYPALHGLQSRLSDAITGSKPITGAADHEYNDIHSDDL